MLSLASFEPTTTAEDYQTALANGKLRHPLLASVRIRVKRKAEARSAGQADATEHSQISRADATDHSHVYSQWFGQAPNNVSAIVVESEPLNLAEAPDTPNDSMDAIHGLLAAGSGPTSERLLATFLANLKPSPFLQHGDLWEPSDKTLVFLQFT